MDRPQCSLQPSTRFHGANAIYHENLRMQNALVNMVTTACGQMWIKNKIVSGQVTSSPHSCSAAQAQINQLIFVRTTPNTFRSNPRATAPSLTNWLNLNQREAQIRTRAATSRHTYSLWIWHLTSAPTTVQSNTSQDKRHKPQGTIHWD